MLHEGLEKRIAGDRTRSSRCRAARSDLWAGACTDRGVETMDAILIPWLSPAGCDKIRFQGLKNLWYLYFVPKVSTRGMED